MSQQLTDSLDKSGRAEPRTRGRSRRTDSPKKGASKTAKDRDDGGQGVKPMSKSDVMKMLTTELTVNPEQAGIILGLGRSSAYRAVRKQEIPSIQIGGLYLVSTAVLRRILETGQLPSSASSSPQPAPPTTAQAKPPRRQHRRRR